MPGMLYDASISALTPFQAFVRPIGYCRNLVTICLRKNQKWNDEQRF